MIYEARKAAPQLWMMKTHENAAMWQLSEQLSPQEGHPDKSACARI